MGGRKNNKVSFLVLKEGDKVHYNPAFGKQENGIVKAVNTLSADVVYCCGGNWEKYKDYTSARTAIKDLELGWVDLTPQSDG